jgi:hypothetical protein
MRFPLLFLTLAYSAAGQPNLTPKQIAGGWLSLFDGKTTHGWVEEGAAKWRVADGALVTGGEEAGYLRTLTPFADFELSIEFRSPAEGNSGIFLRSAKGPQPHVSGYELNILLGAEVKPESKWLNLTTAKVGKVSMKPDTWHRYDVTVTGARWDVKLDGRKLISGSDSKSLSGHIGLQVNKGKAIAFRSVLIRPIGSVALFDGKTLNGWKEVKRPRPVEQPPVWTAAKGVLHVEKGPGQLETAGQYADFLLSMDVRANSKDPARHPNSGIFFRGTANGFWTGYEAQIRNEFKDGDPAKPVDTGTGGIYFHAPARRVVSRDNEFFTYTVLAHGRDIATWINGELVTAWTDPHPEGTSVRDKQAILKAGTISLQAHDPTTNLDFRNIRLLSFERR